MQSIKKSEVLELVKHTEIQLDLDKWDDKGWMRFKLKDKRMQHPDFAIMLYKTYSTAEIMRVITQKFYQFGQQDQKFKLKALLP